MGGGCFFDTALSEVQLLYQRACSSILELDEEGLAIFFVIIN